MHANSAKTHCKHGHEFTPKNTRVRVTSTKSYRTCRTCEQIRNKRSNAAIRAFERAAVVKWLQENGFDEAACGIERCYHIKQRGAAA